jgi:hypothetical protein
LPEAALSNEIRKELYEPVSYDQNPELFKANMEIAASILKRYDL